MESFPFVKLEDDDSISQLLACRVCLETESKLFDVHRNSSAIIFGELTGTQVCKTDGLPQYICVICKELLHKSYAFRTKCRQAHVLLQDARVRQPFMTTSHIRSLDRSKFKHKFSVTNALKISIPAEKDITIEELGVDNNYVVDHLVKSESLIYCEDDISNDFDKSIDHLDMYINEKDTNIELESTSIERIDKHNENLLMKREGLIYCDNEISNDFNESIDQLDTDINLEFPETQETHNIQDTIKKDYQHEKQKFVEITKEVNNKKRTKKKTPTKKKEQGTKPEKKVREKKRKRPCNMKFIEDFAEFNETYNCEVLFLTKEQQLKEIEERKESVAFKKARFQCMICYKGFMNDNAHGKHMVMHDKSSGDHICEVCQARFNSRKQMLSHNRQHKYRFVCKTCDHVSIHSYLAKAHFKWHEGFKYECKECNKQFNSLSTHLNHKRSYHSPVTCEVCNATVSGTKGLKEHNETIHSAAKYPCTRCKAKFESQQAFDKHLNPDNLCITYFPCTKCGENFSNEQLLYKHTESSHGDTLFKCEECQAVYTSGRRLAAHWTLRHSKLTYMCEVCARTFPSECLLQEHQRLHTGEKPYQCAMCPKRFRQKIHLRVHINTHTGERPYKCAHCEDTFKSYSQRHKHILMVHKKERRHKCHMCDKTYVVSFDLKMHIRTYHMKIPLPPPNRRKSRRKQQ